VALSGAVYPQQVNGIDIHPLEGVNLLPAFLGEPLGRQQPIFWEHEGNRAIRDGDWKLVSKHPQGWELYQMTDDRTEQHDVAADHPEQVQRLSKLWQAWADRVGVAQWPLQGTKRQAAGRTNRKSDAAKANRKDTR
jgi:arylsulfatase